MYPHPYTKTLFYPYQQGASHEQYVYHCPGPHVMSTALGGKAQAVITTSNTARIDAFTGASFRYVRMTTSPERQLVQ